MELTVLRTIVITEELVEDGGGPLATVKRVVVAGAVIRNPFAGRFEADLRPWIRLSAAPIGTLLADRLLAALGEPVEAYGKAAIVGTAGDVEVGSGLIHNLGFGNPLRDRIGAKTLLPAVEKVAPAGDSFDIPLKHVMDDRVRSHHQTVTVSLPGCPLPDEILIALAATNQGRPHARIGNFGELEAS